MIKRILVSVVFVVACQSSATAAKYEIIFEEGKRTYDSKKGMSNPENKYLAQVTIRKDGKVLTNKLRGSTLSDAPFFYQIWHERKNTKPPRDADIEKIFANLEDQLKALDSKARSSTSPAWGNLRDIGKIVEFLNLVPVVWSGEYAFAIGLHRNGESVHGKPYVPRLQGGASPEKAYDARTKSSAKLSDGGYIRTINKNKTQAMKKVAAGINVHDGRFTKDYKDSEGCLTIHPSDWATFHKLLPSPSEWASGKHTGKVIVRR